MPAYAARAWRPLKNLNMESGRLRRRLRRVERWAFGKLSDSSWWEENTKLLALLAVLRVRPRLTLEIGDAVLGEVGGEVGECHFCINTRDNHTGKAGLGSSGGDFAFMISEGRERSCAVCCSVVLKGGAHCFRVSCWNETRSEDGGKVKAVVSTCAVEFLKYCICAMLSFVLRRCERSLSQFGGRGRETLMASSFFRP